MTRVRVLFLGGTIAMSAQPADGTLLPTLEGASLMAGLPLPAGIDVDGVDLARVDSSALDLETCLTALAEAEGAVGSGEADAVVVVQGTDTLEETAYLWDLLWAHDAPLVVTGAMRAADQPGSDGPANLVAAVTAAASPELRGQGVLVVLHDEIHAARFVAKRHATNPAAFVSPDLGPVGRLREGQPVMLARVARRAPLAPPPPGARWPRVGVVAATLDDDPATYLAVAEVSDGLVVEGFGAGQLRPEVAEALGPVVARIPVLLASRAGAGAVATRTYGGPGSGSDLLARGLVPTGTLGAFKARVLLRLLLAQDAAAGAGPEGDDATRRRRIAEVLTEHGR